MKLYFSLQIQLTYAKNLRYAAGETFIRNKKIPAFAVDFLQVAFPSAKIHILNANF